MKNKIIQGDCLEVMKDIPDKSIDLICIDPPYNIGKAKWDKIDDYIEWMGKVFKECERVLKDNGSFYFFHNDFLQIVELQNWINNNTEFRFKQFIVWNKRYETSKRKYYFDNVIKSNQDRNYRLMAEYCLYYTFQDETGLNGIYANQDLFKRVKDYLILEKNKLELTNNDINKLLEYPSNGGGYASHYFTEKGKQWGFITREHYEKLQIKTNGFKKEYEELRKEYEGLRYTFNNQKTHHSIWNYEIAEKQGHITPKPIDLIENIIKHSSNENDVVLDCFMGSGTTAIAALNCNRYFIGIEKEQEYVDIANKRIEEYNKL